MNAVCYSLSWWFFAFLYVSVYFEKTNRPSGQKCLNIVHWSWIIFTLFWYFLGGFALNLGLFIFDGLWFQVWIYAIICGVSLFMLKSQNCGEFLDNKKF